MTNSINTNISAYYAQANITAATNNTSLSVARLSSGNRLVRSSDDVAALSAGTSLRTNVTTLRTALINASQGSSLLQVADGALSQITDILQRQKAIAVQAGSGSLDASARSFLDLEFQNLTSEIDRIVSQTNFNGVKLLNGSLSEQAKVSSTSAQSTAASATVTLALNPADAENFIIGGITLVAKNTPSTTLQFQIGATIAETVDNLANKLNTLAESVTYATSLGQAKYSAVGNSLVITSRTGGTLGNNFVLNIGGSTGTTGKDSSVSGNYANTSFQIFATGFSSATADIVTNTTGIAAAPFVTGEAITLQVAGTAKTLHTLVAADTLSTIVSGINANKADTGVTATLEYSATAQTYNIRLNYNDSNSGAFLSLGAGYVGTTYAVNGIQDIAATGLEQTSTSRTGGLQFAGYRDLFTAAGITVADTITSVTLASPSAAVAPFHNGDVLSATINGRVLTLASLATGDTLNGIVDKINANFGTTGVYGTVVGSGGAFNIRLYHGDANNNIDPDAGTGVSTLTSNTSGLTTTGTTLTQQARYGLSGGVDDGIGVSSTNVKGSVGDNVLTGLAQNRAKVVISFPEIADDQLTSTTNFGNYAYITVAGKNFTFTSTSAANKAPDEITIGDTLQETLDNAVSTINAFAADYAIGTTAYELNQLKISRDSNTLVFEGKNLSDVTTIAAATSAVAITNFSGGASTTNSGNLDNASNGSGSTYGVDVSGISNIDFAGSITGFTSTYVSANTADLVVKVGDYTYTANDITTNVTSNTTVRFYSDTLTSGKNGGYFDVQLQANKGATVANQSEANSFATRVEAAFSSLSFLQTRNVSSYAGTQTIVADNVNIGSLLGSSVKAQLSSFDNLKLSGITVTAPVGSNPDAKISLTIGDEVFSTGAGLGTQLGANQTYRLTSASDPNLYVDFTTGNSTINVSTAAKAAAVETALTNAFGAGGDASSLSFQVGSTSDDKLSVSIANADTDTIYAGAALNVKTQEAAAAAADALDAAIDSITSIRANVGALQSRFNFASANIQSSIQNQDAARGTLLDTDIAEESTNYATNQVKLQAGISVLAQANQQLQSLLKLIG